MARFLIRPRNRKANPRWQVELANCDQAHAASVLEQLEFDPSVPSGLELLELTDDGPVEKRSRLRRLIPIG